MKITPEDLWDKFRVTILSKDNYPESAMPHLKRAFYAGLAGSFTHLKEVGESDSSSAADVKAFWAGILEYFEGTAK